jgi:hypothetical protein
MMTFTSTTVRQPKLPTPGQEREKGTIEMSKAEMWIVREIKTWRTRKASIEL